MEHMKGKYKPKMAFLISYNDRQLSHLVLTLWHTLEELIFLTLV